MPAERASERLAQVEQEGIAELVRLALVRRVAAGAAGVDRVAARAVAAELAQHLGERALSDLADRVRGEHPLASPLLEIARRLERLGEPLERLRFFGRLLTQRLSHRGGIDPVRTPCSLGVLEILLQPVEAVELAHQPEGLLERERRLALRPVPARALAEPEPVEMLAQLVERLLHARVVEHRLLELLELAPLLRREALEQGLDLGGLARQPVEQLVEALDAREHLAPAIHESLDIGPAARGLLAEEPIEVVQHVAEPSVPWEPSPWRPCFSWPNRLWFISWRSRSISSWNFCQASGSTNW